MAEQIGMIFVSVFSLALGVVLCWVVPITYGIQTAIRKHYSPHWMWFGIHPAGGWIAFLVLSFLPPRVECPHCGGTISHQFRICPYCRASLGIAPQGQAIHPTSALGSVPYPGDYSATATPMPTQAGSPFVDDGSAFQADPTAPTY